MAFKDKIEEIEDASEKLLVPKHTDDHVMKELFKDLLSKTTTLEEVEEFEKKYSKHFDGDEILEIIHDAKKAKGYVKD